MTTRWGRTTCCRTALWACLITAARLQGGVSQLKKYHLLAVFSFVRLHQVQGLMNLRQVLEAAVDAAFAVAHPDDINDYGYTDKHGTIMTPQSFKKKRYAWLAANYKDGSDSLQSLKDAINRYGSHASVVQTMIIFRRSSARKLRTSGHRFLTREMRST